MDTWNMEAELALVTPGLGTPFSVLRRSANIPWPLPDQQIALPRDLVIGLLARSALDIEIDEAWYLKKYPDIAAAISEGKFKSAKHHYAAFGFFEDRLPRYIHVDTEFYLKHGPDISKNVNQDRAVAAQRHFETHGFAEGRLPYPGWTLTGDR
jgi:hypothetical protein